MSWHHRDRAHGQGLPSGVDVDRVATRWASQQRDAHALWAFVPSENNNGKLLIRRRDEPAPGIEPRRAGVELRVMLCETEEEDAPEPAAAVERVSPEEMLEELVIPVPAIRLASLPRLAVEAKNVRVDTQLETKRKFLPALYRGKIELPESYTFVVEGMHTADYEESLKESDQAWRTVESLRAFADIDPEALATESKQDRYRLKHPKSGVTIIILARELQNFEVPAEPQPQPAEPRAPRKVPMMDVDLGADVSGLDLRDVSGLIDDPGPPREPTSQRVTTISDRPPKLRGA